MLQNCYIEDNWPQYQSFSGELKHLSNEILKDKNKKEWLSETDVYRIFVNQVADFVKNKFSDSKKTGSLVNLISKEQIDELRGEIINFYKSIPREYEVNLMLPSLIDIETGIIEIQKDIKIKVYLKKDNPFKSSWDSLLALLSKPSEESKKITYLSIKQKGFIGSIFGNLSTNKALTNIKLILNMGIYKKIFNLEDIKDTSPNLFFSDDAHKIPKNYLISIDLTDKNRKTMQTELSLAMTQFIQKICIGKGVDIQNSHKITIEGLKKTAQLIAEEEEDFANRIKIAAGWSVDSKAEENQTLSFIQCCIGLECILGDNLKNMPLTLTLTLTLSLADRCSYLIGKDPKERKEIRNWFEEIYNIRSKIVHGNSPILNANEELSYIQARVLLDMAIDREINNFNYQT